MRRECAGLVQRDADLFANVIRATRTNNRARFKRALMQATAVPCRVYECAQLVAAACASAQRSVKPKFQSDLRCASALARAASEGAQALIRTNLAWLNEPAAARAIQRRLRAARTLHGR